MKMLAVAQNPGGGTISAQEFATARQDLTTLLENPGGYVPEQVAAINERVQLQRQRQRERIARQRQFAQASNLTGVLLGWAKPVICRGLRFEPCPNASLRFGQIKPLLRFGK
jgi:hypothetical protein